MARSIARTRVARRIVLVFLACAILPIGSLSLISYRTVSRQLRTQADLRLSEGSKSAGLALIRRLQLAEKELRAAADGAARNRVVTSRASADVRIIANVPVAGHSAAGVPALTKAEVWRLEQDRPVLRVIPTGGGNALVLLAVPAAAGQVVWGEVDPDFLWAPPFADDAFAGDLCVFTPDGEALRCPAAVAQRILGGAGAVPGTGLQFEWSDGRETYLATTWQLFLGFEFNAPDWTIVASEETATIFAPLRDFAQAYLLVMAAALALAGLLSSVAIRRSMDPLERLHVATQRLAARDFSQQVDVSSDDEFGVLADSFNVMAGRLGRQFGSLQAMVDLGQRLLPARDSEPIVMATLEAVSRILPCRAAALLMLRLPGVTTQTQYWCLRNGHVTHGGASNALRMLQDHAPDAPIVLTGNEPGFEELPAELVSAGARTLVLLPIRVSGRIAGAFVIALDVLHLEAEDALLARQVCDYAAVSLSSARLLRELDDLSWGALRALARAIDAKSPWTAGHSDRVTALALALGRRLGLTPAQLEKLERGGLLHDIGKIGVPAAVLDKPGALDPEEWQAMRAHTTLGGRILEPIARYADVIPIVLYHHEKWDGSGYPRGLAGESIPLLARVLAVADVFDALTSERPYRAGMDTETALAIIARGIGTHFEPHLAESFIDMIREGGAGDILRSVPAASAALMAAAGAP